MNRYSSLQRKSVLKSRIIDGSQPDGFGRGWGLRSGKRRLAGKKGLAQRIAEVLGTAVKHSPKEKSLLRNEQHRRNVAALPCAATGRPGPNQCAHANFGKGMGIKTCDSLCFPLSPEAHRKHDQGGLPWKERVRREWEYADYTRSMLIRRGQWTPDIEVHYQRAIQPFSRVIHGPDGRA